MLSNRFISQSVVIPYVEPPKEKKESDMSSKDLESLEPLQHNLSPLGTMSSTLPMAAVSLKLS